MTLQHIDSLCDEFEAALRRGDTIFIEDFLPKIDDSQQSDLLKELIEVEIQFAAEKNQESLRNAAELLKKRFPDQHDLIQSLFQRAVKLQQIGDYEILGELGRGGMGIVYKAKHKLLQQTVAVKVLSQNLLDDSQAVGRFKREMQLIGGLSHPNIVRALNAGEIDETLYLAMEFVDGITLQKLVESVRGKTTPAPPQTTPTPPREGNNKSNSPPVEWCPIGRGGYPIIPLGAACEAIRQAAMGLQNAHELKLVHRDIKPANLMLDHQGTVKILDLGLGKFAEEQRDDYHSDLTMQGMVIGTVDYIAPEQCENSGEADVRSDLYSLGCSLYFLLTGKPVYSGSRYDTMRKKLMGHIVGEVPSLRSVIPNLPVAIEAILQKVLAKDPAERFQTPIEFAEAIAPFASFDELWALMQEIVPTDAPGTRSGSRYTNSPYGSRYATNRDITSPPRRLIQTSVVVGLCFLFGLAIGAALYFGLYRSDYAIEEAAQAEEAGIELWKQWKMAEAQAEYRKAASIRRKTYDKTNDSTILSELLYVRRLLAMTQWYQGDARRAGQDVQSLYNFVDDQLKSDKQLESRSMEVFIFVDGEFRSEKRPISHLFEEFKMLTLEHRSDFILFGGAASGLNSERLESAITRYSEAARMSDAPPSRIRWKQAISCSLQGDVEQAETLMKENPLPNDANMYAKLLHQLASAVLFYYQSGEGAERTRELRMFQRLFSPQNNATPEMAAQPEILELLLFCGEFLMTDAIKHGEWKTLGESIASTSQATANFVRQYPGAIPFLRRFHELLIRSAVLTYENLEESSEKQKQMTNIVRILTQMRPSSSAGMETPTLVFFFLPENNKPEEGFVLFYPQDGREGTLYPLSLTRQKVKQGEPPTVSALPKELLEKIATEKAAGRKIRVSWNDESAWSSAENALTDKDYPFGVALPLRP